VYLSNDLQCAGQRRANMHCASTALLDADKHCNYTDFVCQLISPDTLQRKIFRQMYKLINTELIDINQETKIHNTG